MAIKRQATRQVVFSCVVALAAVGCGADGIPLAPVSGTVLKGYQPLSGIRVNSFPTTGPVAAAVTDANGEFTLRTGDRDGAPLGDQVVVLTPPPPPQGVPMPSAAQPIPNAVVDDLSGIPRPLQIRDESPLKFSLDTTDARSLVIDVNASSITVSE